MSDESGHSACVSAWFEEVAAHGSAERMFEEFERGFNALVLRAQQTLGDVTLKAIAGRVLRAARERHPVLGALTVETTGIVTTKLARDAGSLASDDAASAIRFLMAELLTVIGRLTSEILTPALHDALAKVTLEHSRQSERGLHDGGAVRNSDHGEGST